MNSTLLSALPLVPSSRSPRPFRAASRALATALAALTLAAALAGAGPATAQSLAQASPGIEDAGAPDDGAVGLIEAPDDDAGAVPDGAFSLAPERSARPAGTAAPASRGLTSVPVVVELFTAQGCSTCPPADAAIAALADQPGVLTLSWHVDYWDYLGWPDSFASPPNTVRQEAYAAAAGERGVYTPQIIVDGQDTIIGAGRAGLLALIDEHATRPPAVMVSARQEGDAFVIDLTPRAAIPGGVRIELIRYLPQRTVQIEAGENHGRRMLYRNIVVGAETLDHWAARTPLRLTVRAGETGRGFPADTRHAILVQQPLRGGYPGPILAAIRLD